MGEIEVRELMPSEYKEWDMLVEKAQPVHSFTPVHGWKSAGTSFPEISGFMVVLEMVSLLEDAPFLLRTSKGS